MSQYLSRDTLLASQSSLLGWRTEEVEIPEIGKDAVVLVRELSATEKDDISFTMAQADGTVNYLRAKGMEIKVVAYGAIDEDGKRIFTNKDGKSEVGQLPSSIIKRLAGAIMRLSRIAGEDTLADIECPHCQAAFSVNLTELLAEAQGKQEKEEAAKND